MICKSTKVYILSDRPNYRDAEGIKTYVLPHVGESDIQLVPDETYDMGCTASDHIHVLVFRGSRGTYHIRASADRDSGSIHTLEIC